MRGRPRCCAARSSSVKALLRSRALRTGLLGQLFTALVDDDADVHVARCGDAERALQGDLPRRVVEQVGAAHDVADALRGVVDHDRQLIGPQAVGAPHDEVADVDLEALLEAAGDAIVEADGISGNTEAPGADRAAVQPGATGAGIDR